MFIDYLLHIKGIKILETVLQVVVLYNFIQFIKQTNVYYLLAYFLNTVLFLGLALIFYDLDLVAIILWIVYGGVIIIFFLYSLMWYETARSFYYSSKARLLSYGVSFGFVGLLMYIFNLELSTEMINLPIAQIMLVNYYEILNFDIYEELESLGWGLVYYSTFLFILISYLLFLACCTVVVLIINSRKIRYNSIDNYFNYIKNNSDLFYFNIYKTQNFYVQDYETTYQDSSTVKNFKVTNNFHSIRNFNRRV